MRYLRCEGSVPTGDLNDDLQAVGYDQRLDEPCNLLVRWARTYFSEEYRVEPGDLVWYTWENLDERPSPVYMDGCT